MKVQLQFIYTSETRIVFQENLYGRSASNGQYVLERSGYMVRVGTDIKYPSTTKWARISSHMTETFAIKAKEKLDKKIAKR